MVNEDLLGSMEYACKVAGSKLLVVMGHTKCGAVTAACNRVELGNITALLSKIKPSVDAVGVGDDPSGETVEEVTVANVNASLANIRSQSPILAELEETGAIKMVGAVYDVASGEVSFL